MTSPSATTTAPTGTSSCSSASSASRRARRMYHSSRGKNGRFKTAPQLRTGDCRNNYHRPGLLPTTGAAAAHRRAFSSHLPNLSRIPLAIALGTTLLGLGAAPAAAEIGAAAVNPGYAPDEVIVRYEPGTAAAQRSDAQRSTGTADGERFAPGATVVSIRDGESVQETIEELERRPGVATPSPNWKARISSFIPNDPGRLGTPGGWQALQWNLMPGTGIDAPQAWTNLMQAGRPGGRGVTVAVLDTGVAYRDLGRFRRSPDLSARRMARGYDFVDDDRYALDHNGHGTHVASTIGESAHNGI